MAAIAKTATYPAVVAAAAAGLAACGLYSAAQEPPPAATSGARADTPVGGRVASQAATVTRVVDGDTVVVDDEQGRDLGRVRVLGIDTPEIVHRGDPDAQHPQCFGDEATALVRGLVQGRAVALLPDPTQPDRDVYGRLLRYVEISGVDVGLEVLTAGAGQEFSPGQTPVSRSAQYRNAQAAAIDAGAGMWGQC